jgi:hypothetical protein
LLHTCCHAFIFVLMYCFRFIMLVESVCFVRIRIRFKFEPKTPSKPFKKSFIFIFENIPSFKIRFKFKSQVPKSKSFFSKRFKFHFEFSKLVSIYSKNLFIKSLWFKFEYLNLISKIPKFEKSSKSYLDLLYFEFIQNWI